MKKSFLVLLMTMCCVFGAMAVPAKPGWQTITQSDGTTLKVQVVGNEFSSAILTSDGLTVDRGKDGDFYYISSLTGLTTVRAHDIGERTASEKAFVNIERDNLKPVFKNYKRVSQPKGQFGISGSNADASVPAMGIRRVPIILVQFQDIKFHNTRQDIIDGMLTGEVSVNQYFRDQSNGMYDPQFDVYGIYTVSQNRAYYGAHTGNSNDKALGALVTEACQLAAADGVSFKPYDTNSDNYCDVVIVIFAGVGEAQARTTIPDAIWPCNWDLNSARYSNMGGNGAFRPSYGDPYVNTFAVFNELHGDDESVSTIDGIGTFCHEFGHCLGLPDFYDTAVRDAHIGLGDWDIMCRGSYNNDTYTPAGYSAYEKAFMGWIEYITPLPGTYYTLPVWNQKNADTDKAVCMVSDLNKNEYFIIENRKLQGWDQYLPGEGIMITHVTYNADRWWSDSPNNEDIQLMTLMSADNSWTYEDQSTDLWPLGSNNAFTDTSAPAARLNMKSNGSITGNAGYLGKPVTDMVINPDGTASFWYIRSAAPDPAIVVNPGEVNFGNVMMGDTVTRTFKVMGQALTGNVTLTLDDGAGVFSINPTVISAADAATGIDVMVTFSPAGLQDYNATVTLSSEGAQDVAVRLVGHGILEGYTPVMQPAIEQYINLTQFRADWTDQTPADNVDSYTLEVSTKPSIKLLETADFSTIPDAVSNGYLADLSADYQNYLPAGWSGTSFIGAYGSAVVLAYGGTLKSPAYDLSGYEKVTVIVNASIYDAKGSTLTVSTSKGSQVLTLDENFTDYTIVLDCAQNDAVMMASSIEGDAWIKSVEVYAGDKTAARLTATETGDATYRLITGITSRFYTVKDLQAGGTFVYKVKTLFADGTESDWSNSQEVTLFENVHSYSVGDVNHDGSVSISDVTRLIDFLLGGDSNCCTICGDVNGQDGISIADVTTLIDLLLSGN